MIFFLEPRFHRFYFAKPMKTGLQKILRRSHKSFAAEGHSKKFMGSLKFFYFAARAAKVFLHNPIKPWGCRRQESLIIVADPRAQGATCRSRLTGIRHLDGVNHHWEALTIGNNHLGIRGLGEFHEGFDGFELQEHGIQAL